MAKVIGAEGQRALESALRRKESKDASRDNTTMRSRMALANNLSSLSADPDIDDPSLAYLSAATMADPTGLVGGIASAFGSVAMAKANQKKLQAGKEQRKADAELVKDKYTKIYGDDFAQAIEGLDPSLTINPGYLENIGKNLGQVEGIENTRTENALRISESAANLAQSAATFDGTNLRNQIKQAELDKSNKDRRDYENQKPHIVGWLVDQANMTPGQAELIAQDRSSVMEFIKDRAWTNLDVNKRKKIYDSMPSLKAMFNEQEFVNLKDLPPKAAEIMLQRNIALGYVPNAQKLNIEIAGLNSGMNQINANAQKSAIDQLAPAKFTNESGQIGYTDDFKSWFTQFAQGTLNLELDEYDEDDPLDNQFDELSQKYGLNNINGAIQAYQSTKLSEMENAGEVVQGIVQNDPAFRAASTNLMNLMLRKSNLMEQVPGLMDMAIPVIRTDEEIARLGAGVPFQGRNGGFYITVGGGESPGSMALDNFNLSEDSKRFIDPNSRSGSPVKLNGRDSVTIKSLKEHNIDFRMVSPTVGVRPMTEQEVKENIPILKEQSPIPQAPPAKELPNIFPAEPKAEEETKSESRQVPQGITEADIQEILSKPSFAPKVRPDRRRQLAIEFLGNQRRESQGEETPRANRRTG